MKIEQFVMAYGAEQDRLRAILPDGSTSLRPVLRINAEVRDGRTLPVVRTAEILCRIPGHSIRIPPAFRG